MLKDMSIHLSAGVWRDLTSSAFQWDGAAAVRELVRERGCHGRPAYIPRTVSRARHPTSYGPLPPPQPPRDGCQAFIFVCFSVQSDGKRS